MLFHTAPLSTIMTVLRKRPSATIHTPTMVLNTANSSFWFVYALFQNGPQKAQLYNVSFLVLNNLIALST